MYNVYEYEKRALKYDNNKKAEIIKKRALRKIKAKNEEMGTAYRIRVGQFIKKMINDPLELPEEI
jgi:hypothetical protein